MSSEFIYTIVDPDSDIVGSLYGDRAAFAEFVCLRFDGHFVVGGYSEALWEAKEVSILEFIAIIKRAMAPMLYHSDNETVTSFYNTGTRRYKNESILNLNPGFRNNPIANSCRLLKDDSWRRDK